MGWWYSYLAALAMVIAPVVVWLLGFGETYIWRIDRVSHHAAAFWHLDPVDQRFNASIRQLRFWTRAWILFGFGSKCACAYSRLLWCLCDTDMLGFLAKQHLHRGIERLLVIQVRLRLWRSHRWRLRDVNFEHFFRVFDCADFNCLILSWSFLNCISVLDRFFLLDFNEGCYFALAYVLSAC